ncbi:MAG: hypothetical protein ACKVW3_09240 [Phycisphaerales bacterium]
MIARQRTRHFLTWVVLGAALPLLVAAGLWAREAADRAATGTPATSGAGP